MALGQAGILACATSAIGILSFIMGIIAENKKPATGLAEKQGDLTVCTYPADYYVAYGAVSMVLLAISSAFGVTSIFFNYNNVSVPAAALFRSKVLLVFSILSGVIFWVAQGLMMWATVTEHVHHVNHIHSLAECPTAKTGLMGGAAFLALDTTLFWLVCQMLTLNARADHLDAYDDEDDDGKGPYAEQLAAHPFNKA